MLDHNELYMWIWIFCTVGIPLILAVLLIVALLKYIFKK